MLAMIRAAKSLDLLSEATRVRLAQAGSLVQLLENHRRLLEALISHDPSAAQNALLFRGLSDAEVVNILGGNFLRLFEAVISAR